MLNKPEVTDAASPSSFVNFDSFPSIAFVRVGTVAKLYGIAVPSVWRWVNQGRIPSPQKLGPRVTAWRVADLRSALSKQEVA